MAEQRKALEAKAKEVEDVTNIVKQHKVIALASLQKVRSAQLQLLRKKLHSTAHLRVVKNTLIRRVIAQSENKPNLDKLADYLTGSTIHLFTDLNPFRLILLLEKSKVKTKARAGDIAAFDVVVPAGNTGQAPGPIISQLGAVGLKTRIESGSVWVSKDTLVAETGEAISQSLAAVLSKLGIEPVESGLVLKAVYDEGTIIAGELLHLDVTETRKTVMEANRNALYLSINSACTNPENIRLLIQKAHLDAYRLSVNEDVPTKETVADLLIKAHVQTLNLKGQLDLAKKRTQKS